MSAITQIFPLVFITALLAIPLWKLLPRAGIAAPWALTVILSPMVLVWLWVLAFKKWPSDNISRTFE